MSNNANTVFLENKYEQGLDEGMSEEQASAWAHQELLNQEQQEGEANE